MRLGILVSFLITTALDINECVVNTTLCSGSENTHCINTDGGYNCECNSGWIIGPSGCEDVDECLSRSNGCHQNANCANTQGNAKVISFT